MVASARGGKIPTGMSDIIGRIPRPRPKNERKKESENCLTKEVGEMLPLLLYFKFSLAVIDRSIKSIIHRKPLIFIIHADSPKTLSSLQIHRRPCGLRGNGVTLACYAGGRGSIPTVGSCQKIVFSNGVSPSRV